MFNAQRDKARSQIADKYGDMLMKFASQVEREQLYDVILTQKGREVRTVRKMTMTEFTSWAGKAATAYKLVPCQ